MKRFAAFLLALTLVFTLGALPAAAEAAPVTIKVFSNLPDRTSGQGLVEQMLFDAYVAENPHVTIEVEALEDESYKTKFKAYAQGSSMPDFVNAWGQPSFLNEIIDAGILAELNKDDYADYTFAEGSLEGFSKDGKLYGLPRNTDVMVIYYNKQIFADNGWTIPKTFAELLELAGKINAAGLIPMSMDGADRWPLSIFITDLVAKLHGPGSPSFNVESIANADFTDPIWTEAATLLKQAADAGLFQIGFETTDYATSENYFFNGMAAMLYMGSWDMSLATNESIDEAVRSNVGAFVMPVVEGGKGAVTDITAWNGGGHAVTANSPVKDEAIKLLNFMYRKDNWNALTWQLGVCMSAQDFSPYLSGSETSLQLEIVEISTGATSISGTTINDLGSSAFKTEFEKLSQELPAGLITVEQFIQNLTAAAANQ
jgi:raffinose/stachyose/melibiose transport system substrate-binding protein